MSTIRTGLACIFSVCLLLTCSSCIAASDICRPFMTTFFRMPAKERTAKLGTFSLEKQYDMYICGMQEIEPPDDLSATFALGGNNVVDLLKIKLSEAKKDETISDIIRVFSEITRLKTYDVRNDKELLKLLTNSFKIINDAYWRRITEKHINYILGKR